jgi:hypothetical protein
LHGLSMPIIQWNGMWPLGRFENFKNRSCLKADFRGNMNSAQMFQ